MLDLLNLSREPKAISLADHPNVKPLAAALEQAEADLDRLQKEETRLQRILHPLDASSSTPSNSPPPHERALALADLPALTAERLRAEAQVMRAQAAHEAATTIARRALDEVRRKARQPLVRAMFEALKDAELAATDVEQFDVETVALGGTHRSHPSPQLLDGWHAFQFDKALQDGVLED